MYIIAEKIARIEDASAIVTGEIMGEHASQTTRNLYAINQAINTPIFRPLIGFDKEEVTSIGRRIGTLQASASQAQCCSAVPDRPETHANFHDGLQHNSKIDFESVIDKSIKQARVIDVKSTNNP